MIRALVRAGFTVVDQEGSHVKLTKGQITAIVPDHRGRDVPLGTLSAILKQIGMPVDEFKSLL